MSLEFMGLGQMENMWLQPYPFLPSVGGDVVRAAAEANMKTAEAFHTVG